MFSDLDDDKHAEQVDLIRGYPALFSDVSFCTNLIEHNVDIENTAPVKQYTVFFFGKAAVEQVKYMLDNHIVKPCMSSWASPCLLARKSYKTFIPCVDLPKVNNATTADASPSVYGRLRGPLWICSFCE